MSVKSIIVIILIALVIVFVIQNLQVVEVQFLAWKMSMPRALIVFATLLIGLISGWFLRGSKPKKS